MYEEILNSNLITAGQQNVQMPPRPSSSQSDGSGPARMSHSPMATQGEWLRIEIY